jgi:multicomponent Na+:H+ antiporter subunit E
MFRLTIWFLLTANLSLVNVLLGVAIALVLPNSFQLKGEVKEWLKAIAKIFTAIPIAYIEALQMIFKPHKKQEIIQQNIPSDRPEELVFMDIFYITFTPKTIVTNYDPQQGYTVHCIRSDTEG